MSGGSSGSTDILALWLSRVEAVKDQILNTILALGTFGHEMAEDSYGNLLHEVTQLNNELQGLISFVLQSQSAWAMPVAAAPDPFQQWQVNQGGGILEISIQELQQMFHTIDALREVEPPLDWRSVLIQHNHIQELVQTIHNYIVNIPESASGFAASIAVESNPEAVALDMRTHVTGHLGDSESYEPDIAESERDAEPASSSSYLARWRTIWNVGTIVFPSSRGRTDVTVTGRTLLAWGACNCNASVLGGMLAYFSGVLTVLWANGMPVLPILFVCLAIICLMCIMAILQRRRARVFTWPDGGGGSGGNPDGASCGHGAGQPHSSHQDGSWGRVLAGGRRGPSQSSQSQGASAGGPGQHVSRARVGRRCYLPLKTKPLQGADQFPCKYNNTTVHCIGSALPAGSALVEFMIQPVRHREAERYGALIIEKKNGGNSCIVHTVDLGIAKDMDALLCKAEETSRFCVVRKNLTPLTESMLVVIMSFIEGKHLWIVPHGNFSKFSFSLLHLGDSFGRWRPYTLEHGVSVSYITSPLDMVMVPPAPQKKGESLICVALSVEPYDRMTAEAYTISRLWGAANLKHNLRVNPGTHEALLGVSHPLLLHIIAHTRQQDGSLYLTFSDGTVNVNDLSFIDLHGTELVILSTCFPGEHVSTCARRLMAAGARNVLLCNGTLIDDEELSNFMAHFYECVLSGMAPAAALDTAKSGQLEQRRLFFFLAVFEICALWPALRRTVAVVYRILSSAFTQHGPLAH